ncbi:MAG: histidinol-phosphate transaminase [Pseudomonadota bacterium]
MKRRDLLTGATALSAWLATGCQTLPASPAPSPAELIRLNANENPYGPSPAAVKAAHRAADRGAYYGFAAHGELRTVIAGQLGTEPDAITLSTGSNEVLCAAMAAWGGSGHILAPALTYSAHLNYAERTGVTVRRIPMGGAQEISLAALEQAVDDDTALVYVCNPNNPTGMKLDTDALRDFCRRVGRRAVVLVDEAYVELDADPEAMTMLDRVAAEDNVIITRTFSKLHGLAGLRIGYAVARPDLLVRIREHVMSWPNAAGVAAAIASSQDAEFLAFSRRKIAEGRGMIGDIFQRNGLKYLNSHTNFVLSHVGVDTAPLREKLRERGVLVTGGYSGYEDWLRVSVGRLEDIETFGQIFDEVYG